MMMIFMLFIMIFAYKCLIEIIGIKSEQYVIFTKERSLLEVCHIIVALVKTFYASMLYHIKVLQFTIWLNNYLPRL